MSKNISVNAHPEINVEISGINVTGSAKLFNKTADELMGIGTKPTSSKSVIDDIFNSIADALVVIDENMTISYVNQITLELTGFSEEELNGQPIGFLSKNNRLFGKIIERQLNGKNRLNGIETKCLRKDGTYFPISLSASKIYNAQKENYNIICVAQDITKRKRLEAESKIISEIIKGVCTTFNLNELIQIIHLSIGKILYAENCFVALYDDTTKMLDMQFFVDKHDSAPSSVRIGKGLTAYVFRKREPLLLTIEEIRQLNACGEIEIVGTPPAIWLGVPLITKDGIIGVLVVQHYEDENAYKQIDLDFLTAVGDQIAIAIERKKMEETQRESEAKFKDLFDNAPVAYHELDAGGRFTRINKTEELMLGYSNDELKGCYLADFIVEEISREGVAAKLAGGQNLDPVERTFVRKDGTLIPVLCTEHLICDAEGNVTGMRSTLQDITARKKAEEQIKIFVEKLERSNRELQDFAYVASHDLQEPLRKVQAFADRLSSKYAAALEGSGLDYLERMRNAAERMQKLIQDLLTFSRVATKTQPFVPVNLDTITREVLSDLEIAIEQSGAAVKLENLPTLEADPLQMRQLMQNLIGNALKFRRPDTTPEINISAAVSDGFHQITVKDNGIGFDEKYLDRIFTVFQRLHGRTEYEGSGVGLAVCRKIAERHNGNITAKSTAGEGASFIVTLPLKQMNTEVNQ